MAPSVLLPLFSGGEKHIWAHNRPYRGVGCVSVFEMEAHEAETSHIGLRESSMENGFENGGIHSNGTGKLLA